MFHGIRIGMPFLSPPLRMKDVVDRLVHALATGVVVPATVTATATGYETRISTSSRTLEQLPGLLDVHPIPRRHRMFQHKSIWFPSTYYLPVLMGVLSPWWIFDGVKDFLGGNAAITRDFEGRNNKPKS